MALNKDHNISWSIKRSISVIVFNKTKKKIVLIINVSAVKIKSVERDISYKDGGKRMNIKSWLELKN
jgi:hypothetical protein